MVTQQFTRFIARQSRKRHGFMRVFVHAALAMLISLLAVGAPSVAQAQATGKVWQIGVLMPDRPGRLEALIQGLRENGYVEGRNMVLHVRRYASEQEMLGFARELVELKPDVIVSGSGRGARALKEASKTLPIVVAVSGDALAQGLAASLAHPGGNVTGMTNMSPDLTAKRLQLFKEALPQARRIGVLGCPLDPNGQTGQSEWSQLKPAAKQLGLELVPIFIRQSADLAGEFTHAMRQQIQAVFVLDCSIYSRPELMALVDKHALPDMHASPVSAQIGGLMSYGPDTTDQTRRAAVFVDKILKGRKPADLPFEQPTKFEFVINMKRAKVLGLKFAPVLLLRADRLIE